MEPLVIKAQSIAAPTVPQGIDDASNREMWFEKKVDFISYRILSLLYSDHGLAPFLFSQTVFSFPLMFQKVSD